MTTEPAVARSMKRALLPPWVVGEFFGTFLLVFFGCGVDAAAITTGAQVGLFQVAIIWGLGIATAIHLTASLSGAHLNPAVTLAFATWSDFPRSRVLPYWLTQMAGAFVAAAILYMIFAIPWRISNRSSILFEANPAAKQAPQSSGNSSLIRRQSHSAAPM